MPFVETYSVDFSNGNLHPSVNVLGWPDMVWSQLRATLDDIPELIPDASGITLRMSRSAPTNGSLAANSVYVVPAVPVQMRLFMRVTFDLPRAHGFLPTPQGARESLGEAAMPSPTEPQPDVLAVPRGIGHHVLTVPEPWAVGLLVSGLDTVPNDNTVNVTCQFHVKDTRSGVRINTPGALQADRPVYLDTPLDYSQYEGGDDYEPALFTLEHSFCGAGVQTTGHTPGAGSLKIYGYSPDAGYTERRDHRVYSSTALALMSPLPTNIQALSATLASAGGEGQMDVRLRRLSIWLAAQ
jgi:hypothetical protein